MGFEEVIFSETISRFPLNLLLHFVAQKDTAAIGVMDFENLKHYKYHLIILFYECDFRKFTY